MPRPGPRPYECVRRAWHSDRHQPIRGSIIQQIFRVVNESHSAATRKNREWQEKLPIVVLKAEEIMYSKANSEAEYMDLDTLWDRVNDAVNTIIRRDESSETGELLPPCIEAALNLGCIPVRASRSQRHTNPRCYLSPRVQEPASSPPQVLDKTHEEQRPPLSSLHSGNQLTFSRQPCSTMKPSFPVSETQWQVTENNNATAPRGYPFPYENIPPGSNQSMTRETGMQMRVASVYPLYYGNQYQTDKPQMFPKVSESTNLDNIIVGKPISEPVAEPAQMVVLQNFFSCPGDETASARTTHTVYGNSNGKQSGVQCDLSLRLGLFSDPCMPVERSLVQETEVLGSSSSHNRGEFSDFSSPKNKEVCFFSGRSIDNPLGSCSIKWFQEGEDQNLESSVRKRKTPFHDNVEDSQFCLQPAFPRNQFIGQMDRPGL